MHFGHPPHTPSPDDLTVIRCRHCGWTSPEMTSADKAKRGQPWYCDNCDERVTSFVTFHPSEREAAYRAIS